MTFLGMSELTLPRKIYRLHLALVRRLNDVHIFIQQAVPLLEDARNTYETSLHKKDRRYYVPTVGRAKFARRKDKELKEIYERFIARELYENLIVTAVSQFESFLFDVLRLVVSSYPQKLALNVRGVETNRDVPLDVLLQSESLEDALNQVIARRLNSISYAAPRAYLAYIKHVASIDTDDESFLDYIEIKSSRDLIVHNSGIINELYLQKAGEKARGNLNEKIMVDALYFDNCIATLKRLSGIVRRDIDRNFTNRDSRT